MINLPFLFIIRQSFDSIRHFIGIIRHYIGTIWHCTGTILRFVSIIIATDIVNLSPIDIDAQINFTANELRFPQTSGFYLTDDSRNTASFIRSKVCPIDNFPEEVISNRLSYTATCILP